MSSKSSKNNGSCLGYFIIIGFIYYICDKYGGKIINFFKTPVKVTIITILVCIAIFVLYKIIKIIYNSVSDSKTNIPEKNISNLAKENNIAYVHNDLSDVQHPVIPSELLSDELDPLFGDVAYSVTEKGKASVGMIQRLHKLGFNRAERILDQLEIAGIVGPELGTQPRQVLMTCEEFQTALNNGSFACLHIPDDLKTYLPTFKSSSSIPNDKCFEYYNNKFDYMTGYDFEQYCVHLLFEVGFLDVTATSSSNDFGVDILAKYNGILYAFQCKRYSSNVGISAVQEVSSGMKYYHANVGVVITNQYYTAQAQELASAVGVHLWDRDFLQKLIQASIEGTDLLALMLDSK